MPTTAPPLWTIDKLTYEDYAVIPEDGRRHEILDGVHVVSPAPKSKHQRVVLEVAYSLRAYAKPRGLGTVYVAPFDVLLTDYDIVQPDVVFVSDERRLIVNESNCAGAPDLVAEVVSASTRRRDLVDKRKLYEAAGVREYWIVDPEIDTVQVFRLVDEGRFERVEELSAERGDMLTSPLLEGWRVPLEDLFQ